MRAFYSCETRRLRVCLVKRDDACTRSELDSWICFALPLVYVFLTCPKNRSLLYTPVPLCLCAHVSRRGRRCHSSVMRGVIFIFGLWCCQRRHHVCDADAEVDGVFESGDHFSSVHIKCEQRALPEGTTGWRERGRPRLRAIDPWLAPCRSTKFLGRLLLRPLGHPPFSNSNMFSEECVGSSPPPPRTYFFSSDVDFSMYDVSPFHCPFDLPGRACASWPCRRELPRITPPPSCTPATTSAQPACVTSACALSCDTSTPSPNQRWAVTQRISHECVRWALCTRCLPCFGTLSCAPSCGLTEKEFHHGGPAFFVCACGAVSLNGVDRYYAGYSRTVLSVCKNGG